MQLLRTIVIILLVWYGVKILTRIFAPFLVKFMAKKAQEKFGQQYGGFQDPPRQKREREGETVIDKMPKSQPSSNKTVGEYVDFEEVD